MSLTPSIYAGPLEPSPEQVLAWIQENLPREMLRVLERRWFEALDASQTNFTYEGGDVRAQSRFFQIERVRHGANKAEALHPSNMLNVLSSLHDSDHSLVYGLRSDGHVVTLRMGLRRFRRNPQRRSANDSTSIYVDNLQHALRSNFSGIEFGPRRQGFEELERYSDCWETWLAPLADPGNRRACITGIPSLKADAAAFFAQSVDRLVDGLRGKAYSLLILAEPIGGLTGMQDRVRQLSGEIHTLVRRSVNESQGRSATRNVTIGHSTSITAGLGGAIGALVGFSLGRAQMESTTDGTADSQTVAFSHEKLDKTAHYCEQMLDAFQVRLQRGRNLGFWNVGVFLASEDEYAFLRAQGILRGLYTGHQSFAEPLRMVDLSEAPVEVGEALEALRIPRLDWHEDEPHPIGPEFYGLGTPMATDELAVMMSLPHREVPGLKLVSTTDFNLNPPSIAGFELGKLVYRGEELKKTPVSVSPQGLTRHAFVTGLTGSGKTNTCLALLSAARAGDQKVNFLVIDPAKTEYRFLYHDERVKDDLLVFTLGEEVAPFRLNPFEFDRDFPLLGHIDLVKAVFNAAFPMYASMPYLLEEAILSIYQERGWDVARGTNRYVKVKDPAADLTPYLPRLSDLHDQVDVIVSSKRYGVQLTQDISAALRARLGSLLHGTKGLMLDTARGTPIDTLLERPVVLELRGVPDEDEKAFIMALLFIRLYEACRARGMSKALRHLTLIEEAHRLLRHAPPVASAESANPRGKAVEMFADMMAEMRVYGEGFVIVDQTPSKLIPDAIKGSNLKIVHRLLALDDRAAVGNAMNLTPGQLEELPRLRQGEAIIHSEELEEACRVQINNVEDPLMDRQKGQTPQEQDRATRRLVRERMAGWAGQQTALPNDVPGAAELIRLAPDAPALAGRFLSILLLGVGPLTETWRELETSLHEASLHEAALDEAARGADGAPLEPLDRLRLALAATAARRFRAAHGPPQTWDAQLELQAALARLWGYRVVDWWDHPARLAVVRDRLDGLRALMRGRVAFAPAARRPGCAACPRRCYFGHRLQEVNNPDVVPLLGRLRNAGSGQKLDITIWRRAAVGQLGFSLPRSADGLAQVAGYCLLTQATTDAGLLAEARRALDAQAVEKQP